MANTDIAVGIAYRKLVRCQTALLGQNIKQTIFSTHHILFYSRDSCSICFQNLSHMLHNSIVSILHRIIGFQKRIPILSHCLPVGTNHLVEDSSESIY